MRKKGGGMEWTQTFHSLLASSQPSIIVRAFPVLMTMMAPIRLFPLQSLLACLVLILGLQIGGAIRPGERHSYSLTTFDPDGKLEQVRRAMLAAEQGTPVACFVKDNAAYLAAPQVLPSPLAIDDGTRRFSLVTPEIVVSHSGLSADGRMLVASAMQLAVNHEYTFDENVSIEIFLEEMSLIFQEYTMKPGARPFGASLIVAFVPQTDLVLKPEPKLYRIDPSGNVESLGTSAIVHGSLEGTNLPDKLKALCSDESSRNDEVTQLVDTMRAALRQQAEFNRVGEYQELTVLSASLTRKAKGGTVFRTDKHESEFESSSSSSAL